MFESLLGRVFMKKIHLKMWHRFYKFRSNKWDIKICMNLHLIWMVNWYYVFSIPDQHFRVGSTLIQCCESKLKVDPTLKMKHNPTSEHDFEIKPKERCYNFASTLLQRNLNVVKAISKPIGLLRSMDL